MLNQPQLCRSGSHGGCLIGNASFCMLLSQLVISPVLRVCHLVVSTDALFYPEYRYCCIIQILLYQRSVVSTVSTEILLYQPSRSLLYLHVQTVHHSIATQISHTSHIHAYYPSFVNIVDTTIHLIDHHLLAQLTH
jgi:hypothetical protein